MAPAYAYCRPYSDKSLLFQELSGTQYAPISSVAERELLVKYLEGKDIAAFQKLILCQVRYVASMVKKLDRDELNAGVLGLIVAINQFDLDKPYKLITYARQWIKYEIEYYKRRKGDIYLSSYIVANCKKVQNAIYQLNNNSTAYTEDELGQLTKLTSERLATVRKTECVEAVGRASDFSYLNSCLEVDEPVEWYDCESNEDIPDEVTIDKEMGLLTHEAIKLLPDDEADAVKKYYGIVDWYTDSSSFAEQGSIVTTLIAGDGVAAGDRYVEVIDTGGMRPGDLVVFEEGMDNEESGTIRTVCDCTQIMLDVCVARNHSVGAVFETSRPDLSAHDVPMSFRDIGAEMNCSHEQARKLFRRGMNRLSVTMNMN